MNGRKGIWLMVLAGALVVLGIALGAATQKETFIGNEVGDDPTLGTDLVLLTAMVSGIGAGLIIHALGSGSRRDRWVGALLGGTAAWFLLFIVQLMAPNYLVLPDMGQASIILSNLLLEEDAAPSILLPVLALGILLMSAIAWAMNRSNSGTTWTPALSIIRRDHLAVTAIAVPVLVITAAGMIRVMLELPENAEGAGLVVLIHPLAAVACLLLVLTISLRTGVVARLQRTTIEPSTAEGSWKAMDRIDLAAIISLALVAALSSFLPSEPTDATSAGTTLLFTLRSHGQAVIFLAVILVPLHLLHRRIGGLLGETPTTPLSHGRRPDRSALILTATTALAAAAAVVLTFTTNKALVPWVVAFTPSAIVAGIVGRPPSSALVRMVAAWVLWAKGNTIVAFYDANIYPDLDFLVHPGVLALWRMAATAMVAWVVFDVLNDLAGERERPQVVVPLALAAAAGVGLVGLLELPLNVWAEATIPTDKLAIGSLLLSQQVGVQVVMHMIATVGGVGASVASARIIRPEWFGRRRGRSTVHDDVAVTPA